MQVKTDVSLKPYCTLALTCSAQRLATVTDEQEIIAALRLANQLGVQPLILGEGSNVVLATDSVGFVVHIASSGKRLIGDDEDYYYLEVAAGENWSELVDYCVAKNYYGIENLALIPGSVGAAPVQNIGAYGVELREFLHELSYVDSSSLTAHTLSTQDCQFGYRDSIFKHDLRERAVITSVTLRLTRKARLNLSYAGVEHELHTAGGAANAQHLRDAVVRIRRRKLPDPARLPNVGSFFKNPIVDKNALKELRQQYPRLVYYRLENNRQFKLAAGWLVEQAGWKGYRANNVGVHHEQALVLVNYGGASGKEILGLAAEIQASVSSKFSIKLEIEPRVYR